MDLAGFGYSERSGHYLLADWQRQLDDFMRAVGVQRALLAGHSLGAGVVAAQALAHPGRTTASSWSTATRWRAATARACCAT